MDHSQNKPDFLLCVSRGFLTRLIAFIAVILFLAYVGEIALMIFAAVLLAIILRAFSEQLRRLVPVGPRGSYAITLVIIVLVTVLLGYIAGPRIVTQAHQIGSTIPQSLNQIKDQLNRYDWGRDLTEMATQAVKPSQNTDRIGDYAQIVTKAITDGVVVLAVGLFIGANPSLYRRGLLQLVPGKYRADADGLLSDIAISVKGWLIGQLIPMAVLGIGTLIGLSIMGIPLALTLALFTSLMLFIPYAGSVIAYVPTALIALTQGSMKMAYVTILYLAVHIVEAYVVTPIAQRRAVHLPPALTLVAQLFMWTVAGILGVVVATPLTAAGLVVVQKLYLKKQPNVG